jgi:hypothetical protein
MLSRCGLSELEKFVWKANNNTIDPQNIAKSVMKLHQMKGETTLSSMVTLDEFSGLVHSVLSGTADNKNSDLEIATVLHFLQSSQSIVADGIHIGPDGAWVTEGSGVEF